MRVVITLLTVLSRKPFTPWRSHLSPRVLQAWLTLSTDHSWEALGLLPGCLFQSVYFECMSLFLGQFSSQGRICLSFCLSCPSLSPAGPLMSPPTCGQGRHTAGQWALSTQVPHTGPSPDVDFLCPET